MMSYDKVYGRQLRQAHKSREVNPRCVFDNAQLYEKCDGEKRQRVDQRSGRRPKRPNFLFPKYIFVITLMTRSFSWECKSLEMATLAPSF